MTGFKVVGLDLSLTSTGMAVMSADSRVALPQGTCDKVTSAGKKEATLAERSIRLAGVCREIVDYTRLFNPQLVVVEAPSYGSQHGSAHDRSGLWWLVVGALGEDYPIATVAPTTRAKYATGNGRASKDEVVAAVRQNYGHVITIPEGSVAKVNDICDAIALAAMGMRWLGKPVDDGKQYRVDCIKSAAWPEERAA